MSPEILLDNIRTLINVIIPILSGVVLLGGVGLYVAGKGMNSHEWIAWGRRAMGGGGIGFAASGIVALIQNVAQRIGGTGGSPASDPILVDVLVALVLAAL